MKRHWKWFAVLGGYVAAFGVALLAAWLADRRISAADKDASGGMVAFGLSIAFFGTLGMASLVPTGLGLWFIRDDERAWRRVAIGVLAFAATAPAAGLFLLAADRIGGRHPELGYPVLFSFYRIIGTPFFACVWAGMAYFGRGLRTRMLFSIAVLLEIATAAVTAIRLWVH